ncbi:MAG: helix-turn-helix transcriptional regulator [Bacteroidales bacterium]|nr:helix-turn-helix transcriptional regulator [Bacteroidales bacterium]
MKSDINERFISSVNYLISEKKAHNKTEIATAMGIKPNTFSEILNKRMSLGLQMIEPFCTHYGISIAWLITGQGEMLADAEARQERPAVLNSNLQNMVELLNRTLQEKDEQIRRLLSIIENRNTLCTVKTESHKKRPILH